MLRTVPAEELEAALTENELAALRAAAAGKTTRQDALERNYSPWTVREHRSMAMRRLGAGNITEAVALALQRGIL